MLNRVEGCSTEQVELRLSDSWHVANRTLYIFYVNSDIGGRTKRFHAPTCDAAEITVEHTHAAMVLQ